jgi:FkbM family methyltransferase
MGWIRKQTGAISVILESFASGRGAQSSPRRIRKTIMVSLRQPLYLFCLSRKLGLMRMSTIKLFVAYYSGRRRAIRKFFPKMVTLNLPAYGMVPVRTNGYDHSLMSQIFVRKDYQMEARGVRHILDLGANIGMSAVFLHRLFPDAEIACVEPSPGNTPVLKRAIELNGIDGRIFEGAIGAESGFVDLFLSERPDCNSVIYGGEPAQTIRVPQFSVPQIMEQMGWDSIDVLKLDIEGAEKGMFGEHSSWLNKVRYITGESHVNIGYSYAALSADLERYGFVLEVVIAETSEYGASFRGVNTRHPNNQRT